MKKRWGYSDRGIFCIVFGFTQINDGISGVVAIILPRRPNPTAPWHTFDVVATEALQARTTIQTTTAMASAVAKGKV